MNKRCFAFGCSFTKWRYPTWADFIGYNFEEYYNFANGGINNQIIGMRFVEVDNLYNFTPNDMVLIGVTGLGRINLFLDHEGDRGIWASGDPILDVTDNYIENVPKWKSHVNTIKFMRDNYWKRRWGIYPSWVHLKNIKKYLTAKNIPHKIIMALDNTHYRNNLMPNSEYDTLNDDEKRMVEDLYGILDLQISLEEFNEIHRVPRYKDTHPFMDVHFKFVLEYFPEFITERTIDILNNGMKRVENITDTTIAFNALENFKKEIQVDDSYAGKLYGTYI